MRRFALLLLMLSVANETVYSQEFTGDAATLQALALQTTLQRAIAKSEPAIASILVSRNDVYRSMSGVDAKEGSGHLGDFDPSYLNRLEDPAMREIWRGKLDKLDMADRNYTPESYGSGVVVDPQGLILTNYHVVRGAAKVFVRLPGGKAGYADIHAADPRADLAILKLIDRKLLPLVSMRMGDGDNVKRGQFIVVMGNPFAVGFRDGQPSASWGIISNIRRRPTEATKEVDPNRSFRSLGTYLQTDARLNLGCSGGAMIGLDGELIGLTTALAAIQGGETPGGFATPMDANIQRVVSVMMRGEEVEYGFLGLEGFKEDVKGVRIVGVMSGSPAAVEGHLRQNDVITAIDGIAVPETSDLLLQLAVRLAGQRVKLDVNRGGRPLPPVDVSLAKFYVPEKGITSSLGKRPFVRGVRVDYTSLIVQKTPLALYTGIPQGVVISDVLPDSEASRAGLKVGEIITRVNDLPVTSPAAFYQTAANQVGAMDLTLHQLDERSTPPRVILR